RQPDGPEQQQPRVDRREPQLREHEHASLHVRNGSIVTDPGSVGGSERGRQSVPRIVASGARRRPTDDETRGVFPAPILLRSRFPGYGPRPAFGDRACARSAAGLPGTSGEASRLVWTPGRSTAGTAAPEPMAAGGTAPEPRGTRGAPPAAPPPVAAPPGRLRRRPEHHTA